MKHVDDIREILEQTVMPRVDSGSHRQRLKQDLLQTMEESEKNMATNRTIFATRRMRIAAACTAALLVAAGAWGAQGVVKDVVERLVFKIHEEHESKTLTRPDGTETQLASSSTFSISTHDPNFTEEDAKQRYDGIKEAIDDGEAELINTIENELGSLTYIYKATLDSGEEVTWGSGRKLYDPNEAELQAEFEQAIAERRGEVVKTIEAEHGTVYIVRVILSDGSARTYGSGQPPAVEDDGEAVD